MKKIHEYEVRGQDTQGAGWFHAPRGNRLHNGVDLVCEARESIHCFVPGVVTKIGYPYSPDVHPTKGHLRYIEITTDGNKFRYFYVKPKVVVGQIIGLNQNIGISQDLTKIYPGITQHFHFEVRNTKDRVVPPSLMFPGLDDWDPNETDGDS